MCVSVFVCVCVGVGVCVILHLLLLHTMAIAHTFSRGTYYTEAISVNFTEKKKAKAIYVLAANNGYFLELTITIHLPTLPFSLHLSNFMMP